MKMLWLTVLALFLAYVKVCFASCHNDCNYHGRCTINSICECNHGWTGSDCTQRTCPEGFLFATIANETDNAHALGECSGRGSCDRETGLCVCERGFRGPACQKAECFNGCSGHGNCLSMRDAAILNDGHNFDRSTTYNRWDADMIHGCQCDPGWMGADCSQRSCPWGPDPRADTTPYEFITLVCTCSSTCSGKFKLQYLGSTINKWFKPTTYGFEIANALMALPGVWGNTSTHSTAPIIAYVGDVSVTNHQICAASTTTRTTIRVLRTVLPPIPKITFYANLFPSSSGSSLYFETKQILSCDCTDRACNGTFRVAFDGQVSTRLHTWHNTSAVVAQVAAMATLSAAGLTVVSTTTNNAVCIPGKVTNYTLVFSGDMGNAPRLEVISSVQATKEGATYSTQNTTGGILRVLTTDGRDDFLKLCNGIGTCNFDTGVCECPWGWKNDAFWGPCGRPDYNSSTWLGITRCPGLVLTYGDFKGVPPTFDYTHNYRGRFYMSFDATNHLPNQPSYNTSRSFIGYMELLRQNPALFKTFSTSESNLPIVQYNLSSNHSAGPLVIDEAGGWIFFFDLNFAAPFLARAPLALSGVGESTDYIWLQLTYNHINAFTMDAHWQHRTVYWSTSGEAGGHIYWAKMDADTPTAHDLWSVIGSDWIMKPSGLAMHYPTDRLYWLDQGSNYMQGGEFTRLLSCKRDGTDPEIVFNYTCAIEDHVVSTNTTELFIDYYHNHTAFFLDMGNGTSDRAIIATNLANPSYVNNSNTTSFFVYMKSTWIVARGSSFPMGSSGSNKRARLFMDDNTTTLYFTDPELHRMSFVRYEADVDYVGYIPNVIFNYNGSDTGLAYQVPHMNHQPGIPYYPVGMGIDRGLGPPSSIRDYHDCFGNGICGGVSGNWTCQCASGFLGNCAARTCPKGLAWFHEPLVDNIAHDELVECSNMGLCDRDTGYCICREGFEGRACERMTCSSFNAPDGGNLPISEAQALTGMTDTRSCASFGRCMTVRELAAHHKNSEFVDEPLVYGLHPLVGATWDADRVQACLPDEQGYFRGGNISSGVPGERTCPFGYDMRLMDVNARNGSIANYSNYLEIQQIACKADTGSFTVSFRGHTSATISVNDNTFQMAEILSAVPTIGPIEISLSTGSATGAVCSTSGYVTIYMHSVLGDVPMLTTDASNLKWRSRAGSATVSRIQTGSSRGLRECSGHGNCNRDTGVCECFSHWVSSNGFGQPGQRGDCGASDMV